MIIFLMMVFADHEKVGIGGRDEYPKLAAIGVLGKTFQQAQHVGCDSSYISGIDLQTIDRYSHKLFEIVAPVCSSFSLLNFQSNVLLAYIACNGHRLEITEVAVKAGVAGIGQTNVGRLAAGRV